MESKQHAPLLTAPNHGYRGNPVNTINGGISLSPAAIAETVVSSQARRVDKGVLTHPHGQNHTPQLLPPKASRRVGDSEN